MTRILISLILIINLLILCACQEKTEFPINKLSEAREGCYILEDENCSALIQPISHSLSLNIYNNLMEGNQSLLFLTGDQKKIPLMTNRTLLINKSSREITEKVPIIPLFDPYSTLGLNLLAFTPGERPKIASPDGLLEGSSAKKEIGLKTSLNNEISLVSISGIPIDENLLNKEGFLKNLIKDRLYKLSIVQGSKQISCAVRADTEVFKTRLRLFYITHKQYTNKGYVILTLPEDLETGYYYLPDGSLTGRGGIFYFKKI